MEAQIRNEIIYEIFLLRQEHARLNSKQTNLLKLQGHMILMMIFNFWNRKDLENIQKEDAIEKLDNAIRDLKNCLNDKNPKQELEKFYGSNDKKSYIGKTIKNLKKERRNKIALIVVGVILVGLSIALIPFSFGAAIPLSVSMQYLATSIFGIALGIGATIWASKSVHKDRKSIIAEKLSHGIELNWFEKTFYPKHIEAVRQKLEERRNPHIDNSQSISQSQNQSQIPQKDLNTPLLQPDNQQNNHNSDASLPPLESDTDNSELTNDS